MPFPSEHAARQAPPGRFKEFRRKHPDGFPEGVDVIWGITPEGKTAPQSLRFSADKWPPDKARAWLKDHGFLTGDFEEATGKGAKLRGKTTFRGLPVSLERLAGDTRTGTSRDGAKWERQMAADYGYIPRSEGEDGEPTDVYMGTTPDAPWVYVIHQNIPKGDAWQYDEDKFMLGFSSEEEARRVYCAHYPDERFCGGISRVPAEHFVAQRKARGALVKGAAGDWAVGASMELPTEDNTEWDGAAAQASVFHWAGWPNKPDPTKARQAFLIHDASKPELQGSYKLPIAREQGGHLVVNLHGVRAAASRIPQTEVPEAARERARAVVDHYLKPAAELTQKATTDTAWEGRVEIHKVDPDQQVVYGWLYVCADRNGVPVVDHSGETVQISELEKAAVGYALSSRRGGEMHQKMGVGRLVASVVFTPELKKALGVPAGVLPDGWFVGYKIDDPGTWERVKKGELRMLSIGGRAQRLALKETAG